MKYQYETPAFPLKHRQRGASLLEAIAFLGIAAVVILGAVSLLGGAFRSSNINSTSTEIVTLRTNITKLFIGQSTFGTVNTSLSAAINSANMAPATLTWVAANGNWTNGFNGTTSVLSQATQYVVTYTGVPTDACIPLVMNAAGWNWITVNVANNNIPTTEATSTGSGTYNPSGSVRTLTAVTNACNASGSGATGGNTLRFFGS